MDISFIQNRVSNFDNFALLAPFSMVEFKHAISQMHSDKAPSLDRLNPSFFQTFWSMVGIDLFMAAKQWLETYTFSDKLNDTLIALIPKN